MIEDYFQEIENLLTKARSVYSTFPHHKHDNSEANVVEATAPGLEAVLAEINSLLTLA